MNPQERQLVDELFERLARLETAPRDADAMAAIRQGLAQAPNAIYPLVQTVLLQEEALKRAAARIEELEGGSSAQEQPQGGFLDSMRNAVFGQQGRGSVPNVRPGNADRPAWNTGAVYPGTMAQGDPRAEQRGGFGGGSFLGTAAAAAAGVIGGSLLMNSIGGLMGGSKQGFGDASATDKGNESPWGGDQSKGDLAREAGVEDVGGRQGAFDQAANDGYDEGQEDYSDDFDAGDSDFA